MFLGRKEITSEFDRVQTVEVSGRPGLRQLLYRTQMVSHRFKSEMQDNGRRVKCAIYSHSGVINTTSARIIVHYAPCIRCEEKSAYVTERNVFLRCEVTSRPALTSLFWVVNNVTKVSDDEKVDSYWTITMDRTDGVVETSLYMTEAKPDSFRSYALSAENSVGKVTAEATLVQKHPNPTQPSAAAPKVNQRAAKPKSFYNETPSIGSGSRSLPMTSFVVTFSVVRYRVYVT